MPTCYFLSSNKKRFVALKKTKPTDFRLWMKECQEMYYLKRTMTRDVLLCSDRFHEMYCFIVNNADGHITL